VNALLPVAETIAKRLMARHETIATAESSTGGLIAAALLVVPGASAYFLGGAVVYTKLARATLLGIGDAEMQGLRSATEPYALLLARRVRDYCLMHYGPAHCSRHSTRSNCNTSGSAAEVLFSVASQPCQKSSCLPRIFAIAPRIASKTVTGSSPRFGKPLSLANRRSGRNRAPLAWTASSMAKRWSGSVI
jgi:hypothetical protein